MLRLHTYTFSALGVVLCLLLAVRLGYYRTEESESDAIQTTIEEERPDARLLQTAGTINCAVTGSIGSLTFPPCPSDQFCFQLGIIPGAGTCQPRKGYNAPCGIDVECLSNVCCNNTLSSGCPIQYPISTTPILNFTSGVCASCRPADYNCGVFEYCLINNTAPPLCSVGDFSILSPCTGDTQCATGLYCNAFSETCQSIVQPYDSCFSTAQCPFNYWCSFEQTTSIQGICLLANGFNEACNVTNNAVGPCINNLQCDSGLNTCLPRVQAGANCTSDLQCSDGYYCTTSNVVVSGTCQPAKPSGFCFRNAMCASAVCNADGNCLPVTSCTSDLQCPASLGYACFTTLGYCQVKQGGGSVCYQDTECLNGYCITTNLPGAPSYCMPCRPDGSGSLCGPGQFCNCTSAIAFCQNKQISFQPCETNSQCLSGQCDPASSVCNAIGNGMPCQYDGSCLTNSFCNQGLCATRLPVGARCTADSQCAISNARNIFCDSISSTCAFKCNSAGNYTCPTGYFCPYPTSVNATIAPFQIMGCGPQRDVGQLCEGGTAGDRQCLSNYCDRANNRCAPQIPPGGQCTNDAACTTGICDGTGALAKCTPPCTSDADCTFGRFCNTTGRCISRKSDGQACGSDAECLSGFCDNLFIQPATGLQVPTCQARQGLGGPCDGSRLRGDRQCLPPLVCNGTCIKPCTNSAYDCPTGHQCTLNTTLAAPASVAATSILACQFVGLDNFFPCTKDSDCQSGDCDKISRVCIAKVAVGMPCNFDSDCQQGNVCQLQVVASSDSGVCVPGCNKDSDCPTGFYCTWINGTNTCIFLRKANNQPCVFDYECYGLTGIDGVCINGGCQGTLGLAGPCGVNNQPVNKWCKTGLSCINVQPTAVVPIFQCQQCANDTMCPPDAWCSGTNGGIIFPPFFVPGQVATVGAVPNPLCVSNQVGAPTTIPAFTCYNKFSEGQRCITANTPPLYLNQSCFSGDCDLITGLCRGKNDVQGNCSTAVAIPTNSPDCKPGMVCNVVIPSALLYYNGTCGKPCMTDFNCPAGAYCGPNFVCVTSKSTNWQSCQVDGDCLSGLCDSTGKVCRALRDVGGQCNSALDCLPDLVCDRSRQDTIGGTCTTPCLTDGDCVLGLVCSVQGACTTGGKPNGVGCKSDIECASGLCNRDSGCCSNKRAIGSSCSQNADCLSNRCLPTPWPGLCAACTTTDDCAPNFFCNFPSGSCSPQKRIGVSCAGNDECSSQLCLYTMCWVACTWSTTFACPQDTYCPLGVDSIDRSVPVVACRPLMLSRFPCSSNIQCASGQCNTGFCS